MGKLPSLPSSLSFLFSLPPLTPHQEASIHRKVLEQQLQGPVSDELASLGRLQHEQDQLLDQQLAQIREQQKMTFDLLGGSQTPRDSPRPFHPLTMHLDRDSLEVGTIFIHVVLFSPPHSSSILFSLCVLSFLDPPLPPFLSTPFFIFYHTLPPSLLLLPLSIFFPLHSLPPSSPLTLPPSRTQRGGQWRRCANGWSWLASACTGRPSEVC